MAEEKVQKIKVKQVEVDDSKLEKIREANSKLTQIVNQLGSNHIRRKELDSELEQLEQKVVELEEEFKATNGEIRELVKELEKEYPKGNLDLQTGILTINEPIEE